MTNTFIIAVIAGLFGSLLLNLLFNLIQRVLGQNTHAFVEFGSVMRWGFILGIIIFIFIQLNN